MITGAVRSLAAALAIAAGLGLGGCATPQSAALRSPAGTPLAAVVEKLPRQVKLAGVPFFPQSDYLCGPASLAMALGALGRTRTPESLTAALYVPARHGTLQAEMLAAPRREGLLAIGMPAEIAALLRALAEGFPVVVFQNLGLTIAPFWHYAVLIGYDLDAGQLVLHSGSEESMPMTLDTFERTWARGGYWAMLVTTPQRIPAAASQHDALRAAVSLERSDRAAALVAYRTLQARAPTDRLTLFALGNALLADARAPAAADTYRELLRLHPDFADGWNNLANALAELGEVGPAREAAQRAIAIGGPGADAYRETAARLR